MFDLLRSFVALALIVLMVVLQVVLARYVPSLSMLDLPLISVLYLTIAKESLLWTIFSGSALGLLQDSLSLSALGMNGFTKISIGCLAYLANSILAIDRVVTRFGLLFLSSVLGSLLFLVLRILFLNREEVIESRRLLISGVLNACVGLLLFYLLDKIIKSPGE
jgi:rod shape-determining protein MreD